MLSLSLSLSHGISTEITTIYSAFIKPNVRDMRRKGQGLIFILFRSFSLSLSWFSQKNLRWLFTFHIMTFIALNATRKPVVITWWKWKFLLLNMLKMDHNKKKEKKNRNCCSAIQLTRSIIILILQQLIIIFCCCSYYCSLAA
jgi:hypothetical protein